ncbi:MAG: DUF1538 domain-containing protein, partial [Spirochaetaceae bacterium]|nr:DUF1538 domain-containing protein [Spirochaetaceae bacterium]
MAGLKKWRRKKEDKIVIPFPQALKMVRSYAAGKLLEQLVATAFISVYLLAFQIIVLRIAPENAAGLALGMGCVIVGLSAFIEGLLLGVMPVGEKCGLRLPQVVPFPVLLVFALFVGYMATIAEPSIGVLKILGSHVNIWEAPLLFTLLGVRTPGLVRAIGIGMGIAVFAGVLRYCYRWSLKPFLFILMPVILGVSVYAFFNPQTASIISLAWDAGNVATGPVTVPLIMALGLGISRTIGGGKQGASGFGVVTLASAFPILAVLVYGLILAPDIPPAAEKEAFFAPDKKEEIASLFTNREAMISYAKVNLSPEAAKAFLGEDYAENPDVFEENEASEDSGKEFLPAMADNLRIAA